MELLKLLLISLGLADQTYEKVKPKFRHLARKIINFLGILQSKHFTLGFISEATKCLLKFHCF